MDFPTYTYKGLSTKLYQELNNIELNKELIGKIMIELKNRSIFELTTTKMLPKEQIHWITEELNYPRIKSVMEFLDDKNVYSIFEIKEYCVNMLNDIITWEEDDYGFCSTYRRGFHAERRIIDGVMCLSLRYEISSWDMDYESVTSDNYTDEKYEGELE